MVKWCSSIPDRRSSFTHFPEGRPLLIFSTPLPSIPVYLVPFLSIFVFTAAAMAISIIMAVVSISIGLPTPSTVKLRLPFHWYSLSMFMPSRWSFLHPGESGHDQAHIQSSLSLSLSGLTVDVSIRFWVLLRPLTSFSIAGTSGMLNSTTSHFFAPSST